MKASTSLPTVSASSKPTVPAVTPAAFPVDLAIWMERSELFRTVQSAAARACGNSWLNLVEEGDASQQGDDLLVLVAYCYVQGVYHSIDVVRRLDSDENLEGLRSRLVLRPEQVRRFRRERRRALTDCLTHSFVSLWRQRHPGIENEGQPLPGQLLHNRVNFSFLEPFYLQAQDRVDRAVVLDSMALDH